MEDTGFAAAWFPSRLFFRKREAWCFEDGDDQGYRAGGDVTTVMIHPLLFITEFEVSYYHTVVLARVTLYLTYKNHAGRFLWCIVASDPHLCERVHFKELEQHKNLRTQGSGRSLARVGPSHRKTMS